MKQEDIYYNGANKNEYILSKTFKRDVAHSLLHELRGEYRLPTIEQMKSMYAAGNCGVVCNRAYWVDIHDTRSKVYFRKNGELKIQRCNKHGAKLAFVLPVRYKGNRLSGGKTITCAGCGVITITTGNKQSYCTNSCQRATYRAKHNKAKTNKRGRPRKEQPMRSIEFGSDEFRELELNIPIFDDRDGVPTIRDMGEMKATEIGQEFVTTQFMMDAIKVLRDTTQDRFEAMDKTLVKNLTELDGNIATEQQNIKDLDYKIKNACLDIDLVFEVRNDVRKLIDVTNTLSSYSEDNVREINKTRDYITEMRAELDILKYDVAKGVEPIKKANWLKVSLIPSIGFSAAIHDKKLVILLPFLGMSFGRGKKE